jgi:hypothetical protein
MRNIAPKLQTGRPLAAGSCRGAGLRRGLAALALFAAGAAQADGDGWMQRFVDPQDGRLDLSEWLLDHKGFLPVPIVITEPAVGYGAGLALVFFSESLRDAASQSKAGRITPPDVYGIAGATTENGSGGYGAGGQWSFLNDRFRYRGALAHMRLNLDFYGLGGQLPGPIQRIGYTLSGLASLQQPMMRLGDSDTLLGVRWTWLDIDASLDIDTGDSGLTPRQRARRSSGLGVVLEHDTRDNIFTPNRGLLAAAEANFYAQAIGSDNDFQAYRAHVFDYLELHKGSALGLRADARLARGDVPFYMMPFVDLRGIPAARFQNENVVVLEAELRHAFDERWAGVVFGGVGSAWGLRKSFSDADKPVAGGVGFRYLLARRLGLWGGMDFAWSTVDRAFYVQVGSAWR